jgi:hypothetical protein
MKIFPKLIVALGFSLWLSQAGAAQELVPELPADSPWLRLAPDSFVMQHAAYGGYAAAGIGYDYSGDFGLDLLYGFTPAELAGHDVHTWNVKGLWYLASLGIRNRTEWRPYLGLSMLYSNHEDLFVMLPSQYPAYYYQPTALRPMLVAGLDLQLRRTLGISVEYAVLDTELAYLRDGGKLSSGPIGSWGFSVRFIFD